MRPKEYNRNRLLEKCIILFWTEGFRATGINKIVDVTGVNRASLYNEFENKNDLLKASIELYLERYSQKQIELINLEMGQESLVKFFKSYFLKKENPGHPMGCYLISMITEIGDINTEVADLLARHLRLLNQEFATWAQKNTSALATSSSIAELLTGLYCSSNIVCPLFSEPVRDNFLKSNISSIVSCLEN